MKNIKTLLTAALCMVAFCAYAQQLTKGVSKELAAQRKANISNVIYDLTFHIPGNPQQKITGKNVITFDLKEKADVVLDFQGEFDGNCTVIIRKGKNKKEKRKPVIATYQNEHIIIPNKLLVPGTNRVELNFTATDKALNRHQDYMYTLFVPDNARSCFPCFDQPDLRARYLTDIKAPAGWKTMTSDPCCPLPTSLYSFVAGNFYEKIGTRDGRPMRALYLETDPDKVNQIDNVFDEVAASLKWMEGYTGIANPFGTEYGMVILPNFQFGGQENPGAIQFNDRRIFLDKNATQEDKLNRTELIAHMTAHLWFGDLVAPEWFEDLWAEELMANFMASKITRRQFRGVDHDLNFLRTYQARAIAIDRTEGTHAIAQEISNIDHASLLYDDIIYDKGPVMMRMLENIMEAPVLQKALQNFLADNAYGNASWDKFIQTLEKEASGISVRQYMDVWGKEKGLPHIHTSYRNGQIVVSQSDPYGRGICWPQKFEIRLIHELGSSKVLTVNMTKPTMTFKCSTRPDYIIPNYDGRGYGIFTLDDDYAKKLPMRLITTHNDLHRYCLLQTIHENYLQGKIPPSHFGELYRFMMKEKNPLIMSTGVDQMFKISTDMPMSSRKTLELCIMDLLGENKSKECRQYILNKLAANAVSPEVLDKIQKMFDAHNDPAFSERDYMNMAYRLAIVRPERREEILSKERGRLMTQELKDEFDFVSRVCNPSAEARTQLFNELLKPENRKQEVWVLQTLRLLNSDVYEPQSNSYIQPALKALPSLLETNSLFFPTNWAKALLEGHKSEGAKQEVTSFLNSSSCPDNLKNKAREASWVLMKQIPYVEKSNTTTKKKK